MIEGTEIPYVFLLCWERPIYLWVTLDSLYRTTTTRCKFILVDNGSKDPLVRKVIASFERRSMFHAIHLMETNEPSNIHKIINQYLPELGDSFFYLETDISIEQPQAHCWLSTMMHLFNANPNLGMLGSYADSRDFIDPDALRSQFSHLPEDEYRALVKADSPERMHLMPPPPERLINTHNPPGRLLLLRTSAVQAVGFQSDAALCNALIGSGWEAAISTEVVHRHLSWLHAFDEPMYDTGNRQRFFELLTEEGRKGE